MKRTSSKLHLCPWLYVVCRVSRMQSSNMQSTSLVPPLHHFLMLVLSLWASVRVIFCCTWRHKDHTVCMCVWVATVAVVKSRDMHWGLLAQKDHKEVNLSSLRMLLVADGANPCTYVCRFVYVDVNCRAVYYGCQVYLTSAADLNSLVLLPGGLLWMPY